MDIILYPVRLPHTVICVWSYKGDMNTTKWLGRLGRISMVPWLS